MRADTKTVYRARPLGPLTSPSDGQPIPVSHKDVNNEYQKSENESKTSMLATVAWDRGGLATRFD